MFFNRKKKKKEDLITRAQTCVEGDREKERQKSFVEKIAQAIEKMFLSTSHTTVRTTCDFIVVSQGGSLLFKIEIDFSRKGQEIKTEWSQGGGNDFFNRNALGNLFRKISENIV